MTPEPRERSFLHQLGASLAATVGIVPSALLLDDALWMQGLSDSTLRRWPPGDFLGFGWALPWSLLATVVALATLVLWRCRKARFRLLLVWTIALVFAAVSVANFLAYRGMEARLFSSLRVPVDHSAALFGPRGDCHDPGHPPWNTASRLCPSGSSTKPP
jgi:hypothetical protein